MIDCFNTLEVSIQGRVCQYRVFCWKGLPVKTQFVTWTRRVISPWITSGCIVGLEHKRLTWEFSSFRRICIVIILWLMWLIIMDMLQCYLLAISIHASCSIPGGRWPKARCSTNWICVIVHQSWFPNQCTKQEKVIISYKNTMLHSTFIETAFGVFLSLYKMDPCNVPRISKLLNAVIVQNKLPVSKIPWSSSLP